MNEPAFCHRGACECGHVSLEYRTRTVTADLQARSCQCQYCAPAGHRYLSTAGDSLRVFVPDPRVLYAHCFGTYTAEFMHCALCNNLVFVRSEIEGRAFALAVLGTLGELAGRVCCEPVCYEGEALSRRLERRSRRWIADVDVVVQNAR